MGISTVGFTLIDPDIKREKIINIIEKCLTHKLDVTKKEIIKSLIEDSFYLLDFTDTPTKDNRQLHIHFECSNDYYDIAAGNKVIYTLNKWGRSDILIKTICESLQELGKTYFCSDDGENNWKEIKTVNKQEKINLVKERRNAGAICSNCQSPDYIELESIFKPQFECQQCGTIWSYGEDGGVYKKLSKIIIKRDNIINLEIEQVNSKRWVGRFKDTDNNYIEDEHGNIIMARSDNIYKLLNSMAGKTEAILESWT